MDIWKYEMQIEGDERILKLYVDASTEFAEELGESPRKREDFHKQVQMLIKEKFSHIPIRAVKVLAGSLLVTTIYLSTTTTVAASDDLMSMNLPIGQTPAPPTITSAETINHENATEYKIAGTAQQNAIVDISISDGVHSDILASTVTNPQGEFELKVDVSHLLDTELIVTAFQTNGSGLTSNTLDQTVEKDTEAPIPIFYNNQFINAKNEANYELQGSGEPHAQLMIHIFDEIGQTTEYNSSVDESGQFKVPVDLSHFSDGEIRFELKQVDKAGNESDAVTKVLKKDTVGQMDIRLDHELPVYQGNVNEYKISGKADPHSTVHLTISDGTNSVKQSVETDKDGAFEHVFDLSNMQDGPLQISFQTIDSAGNIGTPDGSTITKNTSSPADVVMRLPEFVNAENKSNVAIEGSSPEEDAMVDLIFRDGVREIRSFAKVQNGRFEANIDLSVLKDGLIAYEVIQTDRLGTSRMVQADTIVKDTVVEDLVVAKNGFRYENLQHLYTLAGTAEANAMIEITLFNEKKDELVTRIALADEEGFYLVDILLHDPQAVADVSVRQTDAAGNQGEVVSVPLRTVKRGDSIQSIAKKFNTSVEALISLNGDESETLRLPVTASETVNLGYLFFDRNGHSTNHTVNTVSPNYFNINADGTLSTEIDGKFIENLHRQGVQVVPFLSNHWDRNLGQAMLENKERAAKDIADAIVSSNLDGVNVDIENVTEAEREDYTEFVRLLREQLPSDKEVSVAVAANPNGLKKGWHGSYDYKELAKNADYLMIMTYDESYEGSEAGPVASFNWVERSIQYALDQGVPQEKIVLGIAHFGRYWLDGADVGGYGISNWQVEHLVEKYNGVVKFDEISKTPKATFHISEDGPKEEVFDRVLAPGDYTVWFENAESISHKLKLVSTYNLLGVGNWSLGQESDGVWKQYMGIFED